MSYTVTTSGRSPNIVETTAIFDFSPDPKRPLPTLGELKAAIPPHCFKTDDIKSFTYLICDVLQIIFWYYCFPYVENYTGWIGVLVYYWFGGLLTFVLFVQGHECMHGVFSNRKWLNDVIGHLTMSPLMIPYYPWARSHLWHHQHTNHVYKDIGQPWFTEESFKQSNLFTRYWLKFILVTGFVIWLPTYVILGLPDGSMYWVYSKMYRNKKERIQGIVSILCCFLAVFVSYHLCGQDTALWIKYYWIPLAFNGYWIPMVTYLQHKDEAMEVYEDGEWAFVKAQLQTIDRFYGFGIEQVTHNLTNGHVVHHLFFQKIPHYHLVEATEAIKKVISQYDKDLYRVKDSRDYLWQYIVLNVKLEYLVKIKNGVRKFVGFEDAKPVNKQW